MTQKQKTQCHPLCAYIDEVVGDSFVTAGIQYRIGRFREYATEAWLGLRTTVVELERRAHRETLQCAAVRLEAEYGELQRYASRHGVN